MPSSVNRVGSRRRAAAALLTSAAGVLAVVSFGGPSAVAAGTGYTMSRIQLGLPTTEVAVDPVTDTIYLTTGRGGQLVVVNGATGAISATVGLGGITEYVAVDTATETIYVTDIGLGTGTSSIDVINGSTNELTATITEPGGDAPIGVAVDSATNRVYVANELGHNVAVINGATNSVTTVSTGSAVEPTELAVDETSDTVWVTDTSGTLLAINGSTNAVAGPISLGPGLPASVAVDPVTNTVYVADRLNGGDVAVIDGATSTIKTTITGLTGIRSLADDPGSGLLYGTGGGSTWVIDTATNAVSDTLARGGTSVAADPSTGLEYEPDANIGVLVLTPSATNAMSPVITGANGTSFNTGQAGSFSVVTSALPAATVTETGALPAGVTLDPDGTLAGTPAADAGGGYPITITASNGVAPTYSESFNLVVNQPVVITSAPSATFHVGATSSFPLQTTGYPAGSFYLASGALPRNVSLVHTSTGDALAGEPLGGTGGVYPLTLDVFNGAVNPAATQAFTLTVLEAANIYSDPQAMFVAGTAGSFAVEANGYPAPSLTEKGQLPAGVTLSATGALTGTPAAHSGGVYQITFTATNSSGPASIQAFQLIVEQVPSFVSARQATFRVGIRRSFTFVTSAYPPARLTERGALPRGITFKPGPGGKASLSGKALRSAKGKTFKITIYAWNGVGPTIHEIFTLRVT